MRTMLLTCDFDTAMEDTEGLSGAIKSLGTWWHHLDGTWLVKTERTPLQVRDDLKGHLSSGKQLLVIDVTGDAAAWTGFDDAGTRWLEERL